jgi:hypothetical protein
MTYSLQILPANEKGGADLVADAVLQALATKISKENVTKYTPSTFNQPCLTLTARNIKININEA